MKRSERIFKEARHELATSAVTFSAACAAGVWSVRVGMSNTLGGGVLFSIALTGLFIAAVMLRESFRLARIAEHEARYEWEREVRPRI